jgi:hypothetical protein
MLQGAGSFFGAVAVLGAAKLGASTFESWRFQKVAERRIEQAERILTATYNSRRALGYVRGRMFWAHELKAANEFLKANASWASPDRMKRWEKAQAIFNRLAKTQDEQSELSKCLPMARALFGEELEAALEALNHQFWLVQVDAESYIDDDGSEPEFTKKITRGMQEIEPPAGEVNEITESIRVLIGTIERICLPVLRIEAEGAKRGRK